MFEKVETNEPEGQKDRKEKTSVYQRTDIAEEGQRKYSREEFLSLFFSLSKRNWKLCSKKYSMPPGRRKSKDKKTPVFA